MRTSALVTATVWLLVGTAACGRSGQESQQAARAAEPKEQAAEKKESVAPAHTPHWTYEGDTGPSHWGGLSHDWTACSEGKRQSPIDIDATTRSDLPALKASFRPATLKIIHHAHVADAVNNGHTIQVNYTEGDNLSIGDEQFQLLQYHFHSPSEHTVGGEHFPMEMHLVHKSPEGKLAVVGVFIEEGEHHAAFDPIWSNLPASQGKENHLENVMVDVNRLLPADQTSYRYDGSLTTPPCSEDVKWIVMAMPIQLSADQIGAFRSIIHGNNRPVQPLNDRTVATDDVAMTDMK
jgi:carbonic anhydrase